MRMLLDFYRFFIKYYSSLILLQPAHPLRWRSTTNVILCSIRVPSIATSHSNVLAVRRVPITSVSALLQCLLSSIISARLVPAPAVVQPVSFFHVEAIQFIRFRCSQLCWALKNWEFSIPKYLVVSWDTPLFPSYSSVLASDMLTS